MQASASATQLPQDLLTVWVSLLRRGGADIFRLMEEQGLSLASVKALHALEETGEVSVKELAERLSLSLPAASRQVDALVRRGCVTREEDPQDRRMKRVAITAEGRELLDRVNAARLAGLEEFAASLQDDEREALAAALAPIATRLRSEEPR